jgi:hypothetical protein
VSAFRSIRAALTRSFASWGEDRVQLNPEPVAAVGIGHERNSAGAEERVEDKSGPPASVTGTPLNELTANGEPA